MRVCTPDPDGPDVRAPLNRPTLKNLATDDARKGRADTAIPTDLPDDEIAVLAMGPMGQAGAMDALTARRNLERLEHSQLGAAHAVITGRKAIGLAHNMRVHFDLGIPSSKFLCNVPARGRWVSNPFQEK